MNREVPVLLFIAALVASGYETRAQQETGAQRSRQRPDGTKPQPSQELGTLTGRFLYDGEPPKPKKISISTERRTLDNSWVGTSPELVHYSLLGLTDQSLIVGKDRGIKNIAVWIRSKDVAVPPRTEPGEKPVLRAAGGQFEPRLLVFHAPHTLVLKNDESSVLNFDWSSFMSVPFNRLVLAQRSVEVAVERADLLPGPVRCSYFYWMKSWLFPCKHPYFAATADDGTFRIENLPLGEWEFQVWHERTGHLKTDRWPRGRFTLKIEAGTNDLGIVKLRPDSFEEKNEDEKAAKQDVREFPKLEKNERHDAVHGTNGLPNEQKLSGKWYGEKDVDDVVLTPLLSEDGQPDKKSVDAENDKPNALRVNLSDATWIELAGVTVHPQRYGWWRADGTPLDGRLISRFNPVEPLRVPAGEICREIQFHGRVEPSTTVDIKPSVGAGHSGTRHRRIDDPKLTGVFVDSVHNNVVFLPDSTRHIDLSLRVADGAWRTFASSTGEGGANNRVRFEPASAVGDRVRTKARFRLPGVRDGEVRFVGEDSSGKQYPGASRLSTGKEIKSSTLLPLPMEKIRTVHFQWRPIRRFEFRNVSLFAGEPTAAVVDSVTPTNEAGPIGTLVVQTDDGEPDAKSGRRAANEANELVGEAADPPHVNDDRRTVVVPTDEEKLQGEWRVTSMRVRGKDVDIAARGEIGYLFTKNRLKITALLVVVSEFTLRPDTTPKELDLKVVAPAGVAKPGFGIYRFDGKKLVLCIGEVRPSKFSGDDDAALVVLERRKTDK